MQLTMLSSAAVISNKLVQARVFDRGKGFCYDNWKAIQHAKTWCNKEDNPCGKFFKEGNYSDCAHFLAHCLNAGGLRITAPDPSFNPCPHGLAVRNTDLVAALRKLVADGATNIKEVGLTEAIIGDVGFLNRPDRPSHAFMVCTPVDLRVMPPSPLRFGHILRTAVATV